MTGFNGEQALASLHVEDLGRGAPALVFLHYRGGSAGQEDITAQVALIRVPTLVISGKEDRVDPPAVLQQELMRRIPHATLHILPDVGHLLPVEAPGELSVLTRGFAMPLIVAAP